MTLPRALVTGASGSIGGAIARRLGRAGLSLVLHYHTRRAAAEQLADDLRRDGVTVDLCGFNVADSAETRAGIESILVEGAIQVLINNAGLFDDAPLAGMAVDRWNRVIDTSLNGFYNVTQPLLLPMMATRWGRIVSVTSISGVIGNRGQANYAAAKAGIHAASRSLSFEVASRGITVNCIAPGVVRSPQTESMFSLDQVRQLVPLKRMGEPDEVAALASFLVSEDAAYITGQVIGINGGMA